MALESKHMPDYARYVNEVYLQLEPIAMLHEAASILLDVSDEAAEALRSVQIFTVFDLATSRIFDNARKIVEVTQLEDSLFNKLGRFTADMLDQAGHDVALADVSALPIAALNGVGPQTSARLGHALDVKYIRDLANWPAYVAATLILNAFLGDPGAAQTDLTAASRSGQPIAESVVYSVAVLDSIVSQATKPLAKAPLELSDVGVADNVFPEPALGTLITFQQTWLAQNPCAGHLLHTVTLAPGESVKLAISDRLPRAIAESNGRSTSAFGPGDTPALVPAIHEVTTAVSEAMQTAYAAMQERLFIDLAQTIAEHTRLSARQVRDRRIPAVAEAAHAELELPPIRVITNHNHVYPLTLLYYEALQPYQVTTQAIVGVKCLFVPMRPISNWTPTLINTYRSMLARFAQNSTALQALTADTDADFEALVDHLNRYRSYYSQLIWLHMDPPTRARLLSAYVYNGKPLIQQIDPTPVAVAGNALVFRLIQPPQGQAAWQQWLAAQGFHSKDGVTRETVYLPGGGVYTEARFGDFSLGEQRVSPLLAGPVRLDVPLTDVEVTFG